LKIEWGDRGFGPEKGVFILKNNPDDEGYDAERVYGTHVQKKVAMTDGETEVDAATIEAKFRALAGTQAPLNVKITQKALDEEAAAGRKRSRSRSRSRRGSKKDKKEGKKAKAPKSDSDEDASVASNVSESQEEDVLDERTAGSDVMAAFGFMMPAGEAAPKAKAKKGAKAGGGAASSSGVARTHHTSPKRAGVRNPKHTKGKAKAGAKGRGRPAKDRVKEAEELLEAFSETLVDDEVFVGASWPTQHKALTTNVLAMEALLETETKPSKIKKMHQLKKQLEYVDRFCQNLYQFKFPESQTPPERVHSLFTQEYEALESYAREQDPSNLVAIPSPLAIEVEMVLVKTQFQKGECKKAWASIATWDFSDVGDHLQQLITEYLLDEQRSKKATKDVSAFKAKLTIFVDGLGSENAEKLPTYIRETMCYLSSLIYHDVERTEKALAAIKGHAVLSLLDMYPPGNALTASAAAYVAARKMRDVVLQKIASLTAKLVPLQGP